MKTIANYFRVIAALSLFLLTTSVSYAQISQDYMTEEIMNRMDQNKVEGKPVLEGIFVRYDLTFGGVQNESAMNSLKGLLQTTLNVEVVSTELENSKLIFIMPAQFGLDEVKQAISSNGFQLGYLNEITYFVRN